MWEITDREIKRKTRKLNGYTTAEVIGDLDKSSFTGVVQEKAWLVVCLIESESRRTENNQYKRNKDIAQ